MTALTANINATQTLIPVDAGLTNGAFQFPLYYTVDSEAIRVTGRAHRTTWLVERGIAGTTAATHSSAASLTRYYPEAAVAGGGGAIAVDNTVDAPAEVTTIIVAGADVSTPGTATLPLSLRLLGPFRLVFGAANIATGIQLAELAAGQFVMDAWAIVRVMWNSTGPVVQIRLHETNPAAGLTIGTFMLNDDQYDVGVGRARAAPTPTGTALPVIGFADGACILNARVVSDSGIPTAGILDIYAVVTVA